MARQSGSMGASRRDGRDVPESGRIMLTLSFVEFDPKETLASADAAARNSRALSRAVRSVLSR